MSGQKYDYLIKLLMLGNSDVGKTSIIQRFTKDSFDPFIISSIAIDFMLKTINLGGKKVKLQIWDTAGQERYRSMARAYYRGAMGIFLVYDITDRLSFTNIKGWVQDLKEHAASNVKKILVGNKCDSEKGRLVTFNEGQNLASMYNMGFYEVSAKNDVNVSEAFITICQDIIRSLVEKKTTRNNSVDIDRSTNDKSSCC